MEWRNLDLLRPAGRGEVRARRPRATTSGRATSCASAGSLGRCAVLFSPVHGVLDPGELGRWILDDGLDARAAGPAPQVPLARRGARGVTAARRRLRERRHGLLRHRRPRRRATHRLAFLHADYGQRTEAKELACFHRLADHFRAEHRLVVDFPALAADRREQPHRRARSPCARASRRRGACRRPTCRSATRTCSPPRRRGRRCSAREAIFVGAVWEDSSGYPDCRPGVLPRVRGGDPARHAARRRGSRIETPVIGLSKAEIVRQGRALGRAVRDDLVLLPGRGRGLRRLRVVPAAPPRLRRGGAGRPDPVPPAAVAAHAGRARGSAGTGATAVPERRIKRTAATLTSRAIGRPFGRRRSSSRNGLGRGAL